MKLAIYGTLIDQIELNNTLFLGEKNVDYKIIVEKTRIPGTMFLYNSISNSFPIYTFEQYHPNSLVTVKIIELKNEKSLQALDIYEGYPHLYNRKIVNYNNSDEAWIYFMGVYSAVALSKSIIIPSGDWVNRKNTNLKELTNEEFNRLLQ